jgi:hypothetical protein
MVKQNHIFVFLGKKKYNSKKTMEDLNVAQVTIKVNSFTKL